MNKNQITLTINASLHPVISSVFEFFLRTELTMNSLDLDIKTEAKQFLSIHKVTQESADEVMFCNEDLFQFPSNCKETEKASFILGLMKFHNEIRALLDTTEIDFDVNTETQKKASPPFESYRYRGMSELDIKELQRN
jgi:hypothetical protein